MYLLFLLLYHSQRFMRNTLKIKNRRIRSNLTRQFSLLIITEGSSALLHSLTMGLSFDFFCALKTPGALSAFHLIFSDLIYLSASPAPAVIVGLLVAAASRITYDLPFSKALSLYDFSFHLYLICVFRSFL